MNGGSLSRGSAAAGPPPAKPPEIAYDAGVQLGRAHPKRVDGGPDEARQRATLEAVERYEGRILGVIRRMANETEAAWRDFSEAAGRLPND